MTAFLSAVLKGFVKIFTLIPKKPKIAIPLILLLLVLCGGFVVGGAFGNMAIRTSIMNKKYNYLREDEAFSQRVEVNNLDLVTQRISCGYATIEMLSDYYGNRVTEEEISDKNDGKITTSTTNGFLKEVNAVIKNQNFVSKAYVANDNLLKQIHKSLEKDNPVAIEWAAPLEETWTLHFSIVSAMDLANDEITVYNPYGLIETLDVDTFISRTSFKAFKKMPIYVSFGLAFAAFHKNTIFYAL